MNACPVVNGVHRATPFTVPLGLSHGLPVNSSVEGENHVCNNTQFK